MSNLTPEPRVDKNGVTNTKWVKSATGPKSAGSIPAPAKPQVPSAERTERIADLTNWMMSVESSAMFGDYSLSLERLEDKTLQVIHDAMVLNRKASAMRGSAINTIVLGGNDRSIREELRFLFQFDVDVDMADACAMITGLHSLEPFKDERLDELTGDKLILAKAFLRVTESILWKTDHHQATNPPMDSFINRTGRYITDPKLVGLITQHPDEAENIAELIEQRGRADSDFLVQYFSNETKSLREGEL